MRMKKWEWMIILGIIAVCFGIAYAMQDETITATVSTPVILTANNYGGATHAVILAEDNSIRFTMDGVTIPTSMTVGIPLAKDTFFYLTSRKQIKNFKAVGGSGTAKIRASYWWPEDLSQ